MEQAFLEYFGLLLIIIVCISFLIKLLKQPIIIGYTLSGVAFAVIFSADPQISELIIILAELGITFLLFLMGLEFDFKSLKYMGKDVFESTLIQSVIFFGFSFALSFFFGFTPIECVFLGLIFMFSSTLLAAKWVEDNKESSMLHGKMTLSILIIQDIFAIVAITVISILQEKAVEKIILTPLMGILLIAIAFVFSKYILNYLLKIASKTAELLFIFSLGICFLFVYLAPRLGYSTTIGAFIAGVVLANTVYKADISSKLKPLILFFNMLFFVGLGFQMNLRLSPTIFLFLGLFAILCFIIKPIVTYVTLRIKEYDPRTAFMTSIYLTQISEFGIIIVIYGVSLEIVGETIKSIAIISVIATMLVSSYLIKYKERLYDLFKAYVVPYDHFVFKNKENGESVPMNYHIVFFGYYEMGKKLLEKSLSQGKRLIVIENDPEHIEFLEKERIPYMYQSVSNPDFFEHLHFRETELVISNLTDLEENKLIIEHFKQINPQVIIIVTAKNLKDSLRLYEHNADYVLYPTYINEQQVSIILDDYTTNVKKLLEKKIEDITKLKEKHATLQTIEDQQQFWDINTILKIPENTAETFKKIYKK